MSESRKATVAVTSGLVCLACYVLACVDSPISWSADGTRFFFLQTRRSPQFGEARVDGAPAKLPAAPGGIIYRYDVPEARLIEMVRSTRLLIPPALSPDGQSICYIERGDRQYGPQAEGVLRQRRLRMTHTRAVKAARPSRDRFADHNSAVDIGLVRTADPTRSETEYGAFRFHLRLMAADGAQNREQASWLDIDELRFGYL